jgi:hypothetical protein
MPRTTATHSRVLPIAPDRWPRPATAIALDGLQLAPKPELHVTLVGRALAAELHATFGDRAAALIDAARRAQDWRFERTGHCLLLRKAFVEDGRAAVAHSLVELVELPAMAPFQRALGRRLGRQLPVPPPHVTLYTNGNPQGIGISRPARLRAFTVRDVMPRELA